MDEHPLRQLDLRRHQEGGPVDRMELEDVLGEDVKGRPELLGHVLALDRVAERRVVVEQGVEPDVDHLVRVPGHRHPPLQRRPGQRDVLQSLPDEGERLVAPEVGNDEIGTLGVEPLEVALERGQLEEPVVLLLADQGDLVDRAGVIRADLRLGLEVRAAWAVPALVDALVDVPVVVDALDDLLHPLHVALVGGPDEEVVGRVDLGRHLPEPWCEPVAELAGGDPLRLCLLRDGLAVLVRAGEEEDVLAALAVVPGEDVRGDRRVGVPQMGLAVDVVDRGGDVEAHRIRRPPAPPPHLSLEELFLALRARASPPGNPGCLGERRLDVG